MRPRVFSVVLPVILIFPLMLDHPVHAASVRGGGAGAVLLRYHFYPGEHLRYRLDFGTALTVSQVLAGRVPSRYTTTQQRHRPGLLDEWVLSVSRAGTATIAVSLTINQPVTSANSQALPGGPAFVHHPLILSASELITVSPTGAERRLHGSLSRLFDAPASAIGVFPRRAVRLGESWTTPVPGARGIVSARQPALTSVLSGYVVAQGEPSAVINTAVQANLISGTRTIYLRVRVTDQVVFAIAAGQVVTEFYTYDLEQGGTGTNNQGGRSSVRVSLIDTTDARRIVATD